MSHNERTSTQETNNLLQNSMKHKNELNEIWEKARKIKELKNKLQKDLGISLNDHKIEQMLKYAYGD